MVVPAPPVKRNAAAAGGAGDWPPRRQAAARARVEVDRATNCPRSAPTRSTARWYEAGRRGTRTARHRLGPGPDCPWTRQLRSPTHTPPPQRRPSMTSASSAAPHHSARLLCPRHPRSGSERHYGSGDTAVHALERRSVEIESSELTAIMGPSGSGKSTLMHILAGLDKPSGEGLIGGTSIGELERQASSRSCAAPHRVHLPVLQPAPDADRGGEHLLPLNDRRPEARRGLGRGTDPPGRPHRTPSHRPSELSGGQQQRVAIAVHSCRKPTVMFADEPTGNLDSRDKCRDPRPAARPRSTTTGRPRSWSPMTPRGGDRRSRPVPRRRPVVEDLGPSSSPRSWTPSRR